MRCIGMLKPMPRGSRLASRTVVRAMSQAPSQPPAPTAAELQKMVEDSEAKVKEIREQSMRIVRRRDEPTSVSDEPLYLPQDVKELAVLTDQPETQKKRTVIIRQKAQKLTQSGPFKSYPWNIIWPTQERWTNPMTGWTSTADPLSNLCIQFDTPEEAVRFAERQGWKYQVEPAIDRSYELGTKKYAFNFLPEKVENKLKREGVKTKEYEHTGFSSSHWFMPLKFHGEGEVEQHGPPPPPQSERAASAHLVQAAAAAEGGSDDSAETPTPKKRGRKPKKA